MMIVGAALLVPLIVGGAAEPARVAAARATKLAALKARFAQAGVTYPAKQLFVRAFKREKVVELWAANDSKSEMALVATWRICATSGGLGPTRRKGDRQVPEGAYAIDQLNPWSTYHLSLHVNYPNKADRAAGRRLGITRLGGDVMVHGDCVTIGCIPIRDGPIEELYLAVLDANAHPPIHIFPARLEDANLARLLALHVEDDVQRLWRDELAPIYRAFERNRRLPKVSVDGQGRYVVE